MAGSCVLSGVAIRWIPRWRPTRFSSNPPTTARPGRKCPVPQRPLRQLASSPPHTARRHPVLCVPLRPKWGRETDYPMRTARRLDVVADMQMNLFISHDRGRTWSGPLPILPGQNVSETDFVELPEGTCSSSTTASLPTRAGSMSIGWQSLTPDRWSAFTRDGARNGLSDRSGLLVGCMRAGSYYCR